MPSLVDYAAMIAVGAFWGCTNPLLRRGAVETTISDNGSEKAGNDSTSIRDGQQQPDSFLTSIVQSLKKFQHTRVWLPYLLNQMGSVLFYFTLGRSEISVAVPLCNGVALVFSIMTSFWIVGEPVEAPMQTIVGSVCVVLGVALCLMASEEASLPSEQT